MFTERRDDIEGGSHVRFMEKESILELLGITKNKIKPVLIFHTDTVSSRSPGAAREKRRCRVIKTHADTRESRVPERSGTPGQKVHRNLYPSTHATNKPASWVLHGHRNTPAMWAPEWEVSQLMDHGVVWRRPGVGTCRKRAGRWLA